MTAVKVPPKKTLSEDDLFNALKGDPVMCDCACGGHLVAFDQPVYLASAVHGHQMTARHRDWFARVGWDA